GAPSPQDHRARPGLRRRAGARSAAGRRIAVAAGHDTDDGKASRRRRLHEGNAHGWACAAGLGRNGCAHAALSLRADATRPLARCDPRRRDRRRSARGGQARVHALPPAVLDFSADLWGARRAPRLSDLALSLLGGGLVRRRDRGGATGVAVARRPRPNRRAAGQSSALSRVAISALAVGETRSMALLGRASLRRRARTWPRRANPPGIASSFTITSTRSSRMRRARAKSTSSKT